MMEARTCAHSPYLILTTPVDTIRYPHDTDTATGQEVFPEIPG